MIERIKKTSRKKILIIALMFLILFTIFLLPIKNGKSIFYSIVKKETLYDTLTPERQANYDKMKISYVNIKERTTGTINFSSSTESDMNGNDVSPYDDYVRTNDTITYILEVGIERNENNTLPTDTFKGGVIKVKATIPKDSDGVAYISFGKDSWMQSNKKNSDWTELITSYNIPSDKTAVGGTQQLSFTIYSGLEKKELNPNFTPKFEVWMEGNKPDNEESLVESKSVQDSRPLFVTGKTVASLSLEKGKVNNTVEVGGVKGQYLNFFTRVYTYLSKGYAVPVNHLDSTLKIEYSYKDITAGSDWINLDTIDGLSSPLNGTILHAYGRAHENVEGFWPSPSYNTYTGGSSDWYATNNYTSTEGKWGIWDSGILTASLNQNNINFSADNFYFHGNYLGTLAASGFELFVPWYEPEEGKKYEYQIKITDDSLNIQDSLGTLFNSNPKKSITFNFANYLSGDISYDLTGGFYYYDLNGTNSASQTDYTDNKSIPLGKSRYFSSKVNVVDGPYEGGMERLVVWNSESVEINEYYSKKINPYYSNSGIMETPNKADNTLKYGVYKANLSKGILTNDEANAAEIDDFDWYTSYEEAKENGKITAIYYDEPNWHGYKISSNLEIYLKPIDSLSAVGKSGIIRHKIYVYTDEERTNKIAIGDESNYIAAVLNDSGTGNATSASPSAIGETFFITGLSMDIRTSNTDLIPGTNNKKTNYNIEEEIINMSITPSFSSGIEINDGTASFTVYASIPKDLIYSVGSANIEPSRIENNTFDNTSSKVYWEFTDWDLTKPLPIINYQIEISPYAPNNSSKSIYAYIKSPSVVGSDNHYEGVTITNLAGAALRKNFDRKYVEYEEEFNVVDHIYNISQSTLLENKTFEILPRDGDANGSSFHGTYTLKINSIAEGQKLFYTTVDPESLEYDIDTLGNRHIRSIDILTDSRFIEVNVDDVVPANATMLASYVNEIPSQSDKEFTYTIIPSNNKAGDKYRFIMNASAINLENAIHTELVPVDVVQRKISGIAFEDTDRNDIYNSSDVLLKDIKVELLDLTETAIDEVYTNNEGYYEFNLETKGKYYVRFTNRDGYLLVSKGTTDNSSKANSSFITDLIDHTNTPTLSVMNKEHYNLGIKKKTSTLTTHYYIKGTTESLAPNNSTTVYYTDQYNAPELSPIPTNYRFVDNEGDPVTGVVDKDNIDVIYNYELKPAVLNVYYVDENGNDIDPSKNINDTSKHWGDTYTSEQLTFRGYNFERTEGDDPSGTIGKDEVTVNYVYSLKPATLVVKYVDENGNDIDPTKNINDNTKHWFDTYSTEQLSFTNYDFVRRNGDEASGTIEKDNITVTYVYSLKPATLIVKYVDEAGNNIDASKNRNEAKHWGDTYSSEQLTFTGYNFIKREGDNPSGTIAKDTVTVTYVYSLKSVNLVVKYVDENGNDIDPSKNINDTSKHWGDTYTSEQLTFRGYKFERTEGDNPSGTINKDTTTVTYVYSLKPATLVVKYVDENGNNIDASKNINDNTKHWFDTYSTEQLSFNNYDFVRRDGDAASGTIEKDNITVTYVYSLKGSSIVVRYVDEDGNDISSPVRDTKNWGDTYNYSHIDITNYDYVRKDGDPESGTVQADNINITYVYKLKKGTVITHHYKFDTNETTDKLADDVSKTYDYTKTYSTEVSDNIPNNYEFYKKSDNYTGTVLSDLIEVNYYYRLKDSNLNTNISKTGTKIITAKDEKVEYDIKYDAEIIDYIGDAKVTLIEHLPYPINEENSNLDGGIYNSDNQTITWIVDWKDINSYDETDNTYKNTITKKISVEYIGIPATERIMNSTTTANIELDNNSRDNEADVPTEIQIPGVIKVKYIDENGNEIVKTIEEEDLVGNNTVTKPIEKEGYILIEVPSTEEYTFDEEEQVVIYKYERIKYDIETKIGSDGGTITGTEIVKYGDDSTKDKIVVTAIDGYVIDKIIIDGKELEIKDNLTTLVLNNFVNVKENHLVEATFKKKNPDTSSNSNVIIIMAIVISALVLLVRTKFLKKIIKRYN